MTTHTKEELNTEWVEDLVANHGTIVSKYLKDNRTIGEAYAEANRVALHQLMQLIDSYTTHREVEARITQLKHFPVLDTPVDYEIYIEKRLTGLQKELGDDTTNV